ncbi:hypothetical protein G9A89_020484 [Geosiphon pyriformis]|nr:hypothetical protein G9A89_020484 [Geosiphon pyriformis]
MELASSSASGSGSSSTGLGIRSSIKSKKHVEGVHSCGASYKKPRKPEAAGRIVDSSAGPLSIGVLGADGVECKKSWGSDVESNGNSVSEILDMENLKNTVAKETSYIDLNALDTDDMANNATLRMTKTVTYMLSQLLKPPAFDKMSDDKNVLALPSPIFSGSKCLPAVESHVAEKRDFEPVKSFALDIEISAVLGKTNVDKLMAVKKIFYQIDGFGRASTLSKYPGIIRSSFISKKSLIKTREMAISKNILVNDDLRKVNSHSDWEGIIKKIPVDLPKLAIEAVFSKFGKIISIKVQLIGLWQKTLVEYESSEIADLDSVRMAKASIDKQMWISRDWHWALLYTIPVGTTTHDLSGLVETYGGKTCFIGCNPTSYVCDWCAVICFESEASKLAAVDLVPVFKGVGLHWAGFSLACYAVCKQFSHVSDVCSMSKNSGARSKRVVTSQDWVCLANIYKRKQAPIAHPVFFGGKTWAQVASGPPSRVVPSGPSGVGANFGAESASIKSSPSDISGLCNRVASLEYSLELLTDRVSAIAKKLSCVEVVSLVSSSLASYSVASASQASCVDMDMALDVPLATSPSFCPTVDDANPDFGFSSSKVLTAKVGGLESKLMALDASVGSVLARLDMLCSGLGFSVATCNVRGINIPAKQEDIVCWHKNKGNLIINKFDSIRVFTFGLNSGYLDAGVAVVMDSSLVRHVCKISEVPGRLLSTNKINSFITKAVNESSFVILRGDFNKDGSHKSASFKKCFDLGLVNSLAGSPAAKVPTWENSRGVKKTIDYVFVSLSLVNAIVHREVLNVSGHFDTDYQAVSVNLGLGGLLDTCLNSFHMQTNRDHWKFDIKSANEAKWLEFKVALAANVSMFSDAFGVAVRFSDVDIMWDIVCKIMVLLADGTFKKKWFKGFDGVFTKTSSRFHKLKLLVSKLVKASCLVSSDSFASLLESLFLSGSNFDLICSALAKARKLYRSFKLLESKHAEESSIKQAIGKRMESFKLNKSHTIRNILEHPFRKVVLDHLVVEDELILEPDLVKSKVVSDLSENWAHQYWPLDYVFDGAFSDVMCSIGFDELSAVVKDLPDGKVAGLSGISNKLWKHCDKSVLDMLLVLLNFCLVEGVLTNTHSIALIEMAHKILSKILSDRISSACSTFDVFCGDNFSVLKGMTMQSPIFAIGSVVENALKKNCELWLVLQDIRSLVRIKICDRFIRFFGSIHNGRVNRVITDFGLTDGYCVHDGLDQGEVFSPLLWCIFYDSLLCKVKRQESVYGYRLNSHFISKTGQVDPRAGLTLFLTTGAFVDDTVWVGSSQAATQHILDVASEFFRFNDISVNNDKIVAILINCQVTDSCLIISGAPISIAKKGESHYYLGVFLSSEGLSKPSLAKAISDKQCAYLVSAVLFPIISYKTQFSFISIGVCGKWDALIRKILKSKSELPCDFPSNALHHPSLYNLKTFKQIQAESKSASVIAFANSTGVLGHLFSHRSHDLQILSWRSRYPLLFLVRVGINSSNNFLAGVVCIFSGCNLSLGGPLACAFCHQCSTPMSLVLGEFCFFKCISSLRHYKIAFVEQLCDHNGDRWKRLDPRGPVPFWFDLSVRFLGGVVPLFSSSSLVDGHVVSDICLSHDFGVVRDTLSTVDATCLSVYTDGSLSGLGTVDVRAGAAIFFEDINLGLGVGVSGLVFSTLMELQAIALALESVSFSHSQAALDACRLEFSLVCLDFRNRCWIEHCHIATIIHQKNLDVNWVKVKGHSDVSNNEYADAFAKDAALSAWCLPHLVSERFLCAGGTAVSDNSRHFVHDVFQSVGVGFCVVDNSLRADINWFKSSMVWHTNSHLVSSFTSMHMADNHTYFMKALYYRLLVAVRKHLYNRRYPSVVCLFCGDVETSDHVFLCPQDAVGCARLLGTHASAWKALSGLFHSSSFGVGVALYKGFVFNDWFCESVSIFKDSKKSTKKIVDFVHEFCLAFQDDIWLVRARHRAFMEKHGLIPHNNSTPASVSGLPMMFSAGVVRLLRVAEAFGVGFGFRKFCPFFSSIGDLVSVHIGV